MVEDIAGLHLRRIEPGLLHYGEWENYRVQELHWASLRALWGFLHSVGVISKLRWIGTMAR